ncbi:MATE family efflux transporter [Sorangium sp. So ce291]|uniref:MATE family efflux transporter n=1 Tax=Sorangium sp. So ce291 TaxID=3133294 RepID=UPI003F5F49AA
MQRSLWSITWPIFIDTALRTLFAFLSYWMVSRVSDHAAAILAITNSCILIGFTLAENLAQTSAILVAQHLGTRSMKGISSTYAASIFISFVFGLVASAVFLCFSEQFFSLFSQETEVLVQGSRYLRIMGSGFVVYSVSYSIIYILNSNAYTKYTLINSLLINGVGLALGLLIVRGNHESSAVVLDLLAKSNLFVRLLGFVFLSIVSFVVLDNFKRAEVIWIDVKESLSKMAHLGTSNAFEVLSFQLFHVVLLRIISVTGIHSVAARSYVMSITGIFEIPSLAIARGNQILLGHAIGAAEFDRARAQLRQALVSSTALSLVGLGLGLAFQVELLGVFSEMPQTVAVGLQIFEVALAISFFKGIGTNVTAALKAAGDVKFCVRLTTLSMWCLAIPGVFLAVEYFHLDLRTAWLILAADELFRLFVILRRWRDGGWQRINLVSRLEHSQGEIAESPSRA